MISEKKEKTHKIKKTKSYSKNFRVSKHPEHKDSSNLSSSIKNPVVPKTKKLPIVKNKNVVPTIIENKNVVPTPVKKGGLDSARIPRKIRYPFVGSESLRELLGRLIPYEFIPTKKSGYILTGIFILVIIIGIFQFPYGLFMKGDLDIELKVGEPLVFLNFKIFSPSEPPLIIKGFIIDLLLYTLISYILDVVLNFMLKTSFLLSKKDKGKIPKIFRDIKPENVAERVTQKVFIDKHSSPKANKNMVPHQISKKIVKINSKK